MRERLIELESILVREFRPNFLAIESDQHEEKPYIHVIISANEFNTLPVDKRVALVYKKIMDNSEQLATLPIIVETFSSTEMVDVFEYIK